MSKSAAFLLALAAFPFLLQNALAQPPRTYDPATMSPRTADEGAMFDQWIASRESLVMLRVSEAQQLKRRGRCAAADRALAESEETLRAARVGWPGKQGLETLVAHARSLPCPPLAGAAWAYDPASERAETAEEDLLRRRWLETREYLVTTKLMEADDFRRENRCDAFVQAIADAEGALRAIPEHAPTRVALAARLADVRAAPCPPGPEDILAEASTETSRDLLRDRGPSEADDPPPASAAASDTSLAGNWRMIADPLDRTWRVVENGAEVRLLSEERGTGETGAIVGVRRGDAIEVTATPGGAYVCPPGAPPREPPGASRIAIGAGGNSMTMSSRPLTVGTDCRITLGDWQLAARFERVAATAAAVPTSPATPAPRMPPPRAVPPPAEMRAPLAGLCPDRMPPNATSLACRCPALAGEASVWGTYYYTDDSFLCPAAVHAGAVGRGGGTIRARAEVGRGFYVGSTQFGIRSSDYGRWRRTIVFDGASAAGEIVGSVPRCPPGFDRDELARSAGVCLCPAPSDSGGVWGTDIYTGDSNLCRAARHAGAIGAGGGVIRVITLPGESHYRGSERNGIQSADWGGYNVSFAVRASAPPPPATRLAPARAEPVPVTPPPSRGRIDYSDVGFDSSVEGTRQLAEAFYEGRPLYVRCAPAPAHTVSSREGRSYESIPPDEYYVWGSGPYAYDSSICAAAVHAGVIGYGGGRVQVVAASPDGNVLRVPPRSLQRAMIDLRGSLAHGVRSRDVRVDRRNLMLVFAGP